MDDRHLLHQVNWDGSVNCAPTRGGHDGTTRLVKRAHPQDGGPRFWRTQVRQVRWLRIFDVPVRDSLQARVMLAAVRERGAV